MAGSMTVGMWFYCEKATQQQIKKEPEERYLQPVLVRTKVFQAISLIRPLIYLSINAIFHLPWTINKKYYLYNETAAKEFLLFFSAF